MLRRLLFLPLLGVLLLFSACNGSAPAPSPTPGDPNVLPMMMMVEGVLYQHDVGVLDSSIKIEDSQILGYITKSLPNEVPKHDGEACWLDVGTPYARCPLEEYPAGMVALIPGLIVDEWWIFLPEAQVRS